MHQTILMHADIDKGTEVGHVGNHPFQRHARLEVLQALDPFLEFGRLELGARIATGFVQLAQDVGNSRDTKVFVGVTRRFQLA